MAYCDRRRRRTAFLVFRGHVVPPRAKAVALFEAPRDKPSMPDRETKPLLERKAQFTTLSGIPLERVYDHHSVADSEADGSIGFPGEYPYTRGIYPTM